MSEMTDRKRQILRAVVIEYVTAAEPVSSDLIATKYSLGVRSATVRNELADITDLGYLEQPHTSAGRRPSDMGYRFFVDHLTDPVQPSADEKGQITATQRDETLKDLVQESAKALSRMTRMMSAAVTVRDGNIEVRNAVLTALGPDKALLVVLLVNGHVENRIIECPHGLTLDHVGRANEILSKSISGKPLGSIAKMKMPGSSGEAVLDKLMSAVFQATITTAKDLTRGSLMIEGEEFVFSQPEFLREPESLERLVGSLSDEESLRQEVGMLGSSDRKITIGREHSREMHYPLTIARQSFFIGDREAGVLAIIGPTRMNYNRNLTLLDYTAGAISQVITRVFG
ncbi:heat-inducible transcriptional repressor HrcA [Kamptonema cortianum]|nr:heat-inducible transcriptional repressor HrcA [Geitlerinema splendidum]MDK3158870.1 heat-inducible transcriptional repressor HrcA [Kamptonema cortianum]